MDCSWGCKLRWTNTKFGYRIWNLRLNPHNTGRLGMTLLKISILLAVLAPHSMVYVKGHSRAADRVRDKLAVFTCYRSGADRRSSAAILQVDHILSRSGHRSWLVMYLLDNQNRVLWEGKAEELPWPLPSSLSRLLRHLAKSTCSGGCSDAGMRAPSPNRRAAAASACSQNPPSAAALQAAQGQEPLR